MLCTLSFLRLGVHGLSICNGHAHNLIHPAAKIEMAWQTKQSNTEITSY